MHFLIFACLRSFRYLRTFLNVPQKYHKINYVVPSYKGEIRGTFVPQNRLSGPGANARRGNLNEKKGDACRGGGLQETTGVGVGLGSSEARACVCLGRPRLLLVRDEL